MTYFSNSMLRGLFFLFLTLATCNLYSALPQPESTLKRSPNFNIKHPDENELTDLIESAHCEKNAAILGYLLYEYGCDSESVKNFSIEMARNNVPPQNVFAIMQVYTKCIDDADLSKKILVSFINHVLQQSVIDGNVNYVVYFLTDPACEKFILIEHINTALENLSFCHDYCFRKTLEFFLHKYQTEHVQEVVLNFGLFIVPAPED
ncbi:MAG: hypothetical protein WC365_04055 [Candidatus Babeliales bacterium]